MDKHATQPEIELKDDLTPEQANENFLGILRKVVAADPEKVKRSLQTAKERRAVERTQKQTQTT